MKAGYIEARCKKVSGLTVKAALETKVSDSKGISLLYKLKDLKYDLFRGFLTAKCG